MFGVPPGSWLLAPVAIAALILASPPLRAADAVPTSPPEWIQVRAPNLESRTDRPLRYRPDGTDFVIENGTEFFNRPLYCLNAPFRVDGGDKPEFSLYAGGRGGNLRFGLKNSSGAKWLHDAKSIVTRYRPGSLLYEIRDPLLGKGVLRLAILPLSASRGFVVRTELAGAPAPAELLFAFGGVNGQRGSRNGDIGCEREPVSKFFQLRPEQCRSNVFTLAGHTFTVRGSRGLRLAGTAPADARLALADAAKWSSPTGLLGTAGKATDLPVLAGWVALPTGQPLYFTLQQAGSDTDGDDSTAAPVSSSALFTAAEERRRALAGRVVVETPDPFINAAAAALNVAADGIWDESQGAFMHGAVAWRNRLLGWRGAYSADALGWHDRAQRYFLHWAGRQNTNPVPTGIPSADPKANLSRNEPGLHSNGDMSNTHYDMNLVYMDALFRHLLWTGDLDFARRQWPVIERHLAWERRLFRREFGPDKLPLYEAYAAIWASDDMQYHGGGVAHTSAYNHYHNQMAARVARLIGQDAAPYEREAELIAQGMRQFLWTGGWFAEWKDSLGLQLVHSNAGLWTFYHTLDSEVPSPLEAWQMTRFVETQIARIPLRGPGVPDGNYTLPTTSWMPYVWSLNNVVMAEVAHTALACWQAGRPDAAFPLFKGCLLDSMYLGLCPGNVGMTTSFDMARREAQRDFGDAAGITARALVEGLFGVQPDALAQELRIRSGFPAVWNRAAIRHPDFNLSFQRDGTTETWIVESRFPKPMALRLQSPALRTGIASVKVNGDPAAWRALEDSLGVPRIEIQGVAARRHEVVVVWKDEKPAATEAPEVVLSGETFSARFGRALIRDLADPRRALQNVVTNDSAIRAVASNAGPQTVFVKLQQGALTWWSPLAFEVRPPFELVPVEPQKADGLRFRVRNHTADGLDMNVSVHIGRQQAWTRLRAPARGDSQALFVPAHGLLPGAKPVRVDLGLGRFAEGTVTNWKLKPARPFQLDPVDLAPHFNDRVTQIFRNEYLSPRSPFCSLAIPKQGIGSWCDFETQFEVDDSGLRREASRNDGRLLLPSGLPFRTPGEGAASNIVFTSQWDNYPRQATVPLSGKAAHAYLLLAGSSNPMQSRCDNGEVVVAYADGSTARLALRNPENWWLIDQDYFIDDYAFRRPEPIPPRVDLKTGKVRLLEVATFKGKGGKVPGGAATILDLPLDPDRELKSLTVRTLANEVVIGLMAVTLAR